MSTLRAAWVPPSMVEPGAPGHRPAPPGSDGSSVASFAAPGAGRSPSRAGWSPAAPGSAWLSEGYAPWSACGLTAEVSACWAIISTAPAGRGGGASAVQYSTTLLQRVVGGLCGDWGRKSKSVAGHFLERGRLAVWGRGRPLSLVLRIQPPGFIAFYLVGSGLPRWH